MADTEVIQPAEDDFDAGFSAGQEPGSTETVEPPDDNQASEQAAAPSTEGVVTSGAEKTEAPVVETVAAEAPKRNLGRLSTDELLELVRNGDPDAPRAIELRLRRNDNNTQPKRNSKALDDIERNGAAVKAGISKLEQDFPEIAAGLAPVTAFVDSVAAPLREVDRAAALEESRARVEQTFPGFVQVVSKEEFPRWLKEQPEDVRRDFASGGIDGAINVLDAYDTHIQSQGKPSPFAPQPAANSAPEPSAPDKAAKAAQIILRRQQALKTAASVPTGARNASSIPAARDDFDAGYEAAGRNRSG